MISSVSLLNYAYTPSRCDSFGGGKINIPHPGMFYTVIYVDMVLLVEVK
jgi:hypothetical protein